jgi:hypothetical protein
MPLDEYLKEVENLAIDFPMILLLLVLLEISLTSFLITT